MSLLNDAEAMAANAILPGSGIAVKLWAVLKPILPWILLVAGIAAGLWAIERHGEARGKAAAVARYQPVMDRALVAERTAGASILRLRTAIDQQNAATLAVARAELTKLAAAQVALAAARSHDRTRAAQIARLTADAAKPIPGKLCDATDSVKDLWK